MTRPSRVGRIELATILLFIRPGDELAVTRIDRLGRDTRDVLNLIHEVGVARGFRHRAGPVRVDEGEMGQVVLTVLGVVAQMQRRFIKERQKEGIARAKADGIYKGGKPRLDRDRIKSQAGGGVAIAEIARRLGCSRMQVYRGVAEWPLRPLGARSGHRNSAAADVERLPRSLP